MVFHFFCHIEEACLIEAGACVNCDCSTLFVLRLVTLACVTHVETREE